MTTFDVTGPLPTRTMLLEASAGTGKTYTIAAMAARFIAQRGLDVSELLLITFGNHAAGEMRTRVFARLQSVVAHMDRISAGLPADPLTGEDPVAALLMEGDAALHRSRLVAALARFNDATILTTHSFCQAMLYELGILGDWDPTEAVGEDPMGLVRECATDVYLRMFSTDDSPRLQPRDAIRIGEEACTKDLPLLPSSGEHFEYATAVRELYALRKGVQGVCTFNDVTARLKKLLTDEETGPLVAAELQRRFTVVLVDEFQDTDPDQWAILLKAFVGPDRPTVLIGDPKQSIYGFRGADLGSYLAARDHAEVASLGTNYRTDKPLADGVVSLFGTTTLGAPTVTVTPVAAHFGPRTGLPSQSRLWVVRGAQDDVATEPAEAAIERNLIAHVRKILATEGPRAGVRFSPSDIAVLVRTTARGKAIRDALTQAGHPAVLTGSQSVWHQPANDEWVALLRAMADPTQAHIRLAAMTPLIGSSITELFASDASESARVSTLVHTLEHLWAAGRSAAVLTHLRTHTGLDARILKEPDGERLLADFIHLAELFDASGETTLEGLIALAEERHASGEDSDSLRVSTDQPAIRVMTIHAAKGLEFPVVLLPQTEGVSAQRTKPFSIVENGQRHLYIGPSPAWNDELTRDLKRQNMDEELRLLYVAFTRAQHLAIAWHIAARKGAKTDSPLAQLLDQRSTMGIPGVLFTDLHTVPTTVHAPEPEEPPAPLQLGRLNRTVDQTWRRTSYSGLTQGLHETAMRITTDEAVELDLTTAEPMDPALELPSPMSELPAGTAFGTLVHEALELLEWGPETLESHAAELLVEIGPAHSLDAAESGQLAEALVQLCRTPLLPLTPQALTDVPTSKRLPELDFDLPLGNHSAPTTLRELAALMAEHLPSDDPLAPYPERLAASDAADAVLNGFLTGSIDGVLQLGEQFVVVDYKTNRLAPSAQDALVVGHYTQPAMAEAMMQAHYPLQAILYCAALHRYLGQRLAGYSPERHLGGVGYLFVRGMAGAQTPVIDGASCGVFGWFPPAALVTAVSDLLGGTRA
ncbi:MAG: UvrD-helicase domain-containing protein [Propionibacteriaceae bacterium]|nr:UvrD-helicase domain-containing protein [Propionibacteriaceae bacterium]